MRAARGSAVALVALGSLLGSGCRSNQPLKARPVESGKLTLPEADLSADPLQAGRLWGDRRFLGSVVLMRPDATALGLVGLVDAARATRLAKADLLAFRARELSPKITEREALVAELSRVETEASAGENVRAARWAAATSWFSTYDDGSPRAKAALGAYCEAKIWELATTAKSLAALYYERPVPLAACEPHYAAAGLLGGEACAASPDAARSYASCLWNEGVFKTAFFKGRYAEAKVEKLATALADGTLLVWFTGASAPKALQAAMRLEKAKLASVFGGAGNKDVFVPEAGTPQAAPELTPAGASPAMMIEAVEDGPTTAAGPMLSPLADVARNDELAKSLRPFAARESGEPSVNDFLFTKAAPSWSEPVNYGVVRDGPAFAGLFAAKDPRYGFRLEELGAAVLTATSAENAVRAAESGRSETFTAALHKGAIAATADGVALGLWATASLKLTPAEDGGAHASFKLDDAAQAMDAATHDPATGILTVTQTLADPTAQGLALAPRAEPGRGEPFCELASETLTGATLTLKLEPRQIGEALTFYSGVVKLKLVDGTEYEGGANLLGEE